jgi:DNA replication licensing factor MCM7
MQVTPRSLLGIIRLSQAIARLHFRNTIHKEDIDEALRLISSCTNSIMNETVQVGGKLFNDINRLERL